MVAYLISLTIYAGIFSIFSLGLNLQWGFTGLINFGHVAFMTIGAYTTILLNMQGIPMIFSVLIGTILAALLGLLIGISTLRLREDYLAIVTIGVAELVRLIALNEEWLTKGSFGLQGYPLPLDDLPSNLWTKVIMIAIITTLGILSIWQLLKTVKHKLVLQKLQKKTHTIGTMIWGLIALALILVVYINTLIGIQQYNSRLGLMLLVLVVLAIIYWGLELLVNSPWGRVLKSIREDEEVTKALGKNVFWYKLQSLMIGGAIAGISGSFYAWQLQTVYPNNFQPLVTFNAWTIVVLGGAGNNVGTILGSLIFWAYDSLTRFPKIDFISTSQLGALRIMIIGLILMVLMMWRPQGLLGNKDELTLNK